MFWRWFLILEECHVELLLDELDEVYRTLDGRRRLVVDGAMKVAREHGMMAAAGKFMSDAVKVDEKMGDDLSLVDIMVRYRGGGDLLSFYGSIVLTLAGKVGEDADWV